MLQEDLAEDQAKDRTCYRVTNQTSAKATSEASLHRRCPKKLRGTPRGLRYSAVKKLRINRNHCVHHEYSLLFKPVED